MNTDINMIDKTILDPKIKALLKHYDFKFVVDDLNKYKHHAIGIGDILNVFTYLKSNIIPGPMVFPIFILFGTHYYPDPLNALEFRFRLIYDLLKSNSLSMNQFLIVIPTNSKEYIDDLLIKSPNVSWMHHSGTYIPKYNIHVKSFTLDLAGINRKYIPTQLLDKPYIVFNTKLRFNSKFNYRELKNNMSTFFKTYKTNYTIVLLGERVLGRAREVLSHNMQTMYHELLELKTNNDVIDLTIETINNNLDYDLYVKDCSIMHYAEYSICCGLGGHFCSSLAFAKNIITFESTYETNMDNVANLNSYKDFNNYLSKLKSIALP